MVDLARVAWGKDNPTFRQVFTSRFIPGGSPEQLQWFNDLCLKTTSGEIVADLLEARAAVDISGVARRGAHADARPARARRRGDTRSRKGASSPAAFRAPSSSSSTRAITSCSSTSRRGSGSARRCSRFCSPEKPAGDSAFAALSARERQVLALMADGLSNTDIAERLNISEKTVRNHASNLFDKLGVWSRAQAIVFARDHGFSG